MDAVRAGRNKPIDDATIHDHLVRLEETFALRSVKHAHFKC
jgi:hypothetical protein